MKFSYRIKLLKLYAAVALTSLFCISVCHALEIGKPAPALQATTFDGQAFSVEKSAGEVVIVHFWATWCAPCRQEMPILDTYYLQHKAQGLRVLAISMNDPADKDAVRKFMQQFHFPAAFERDADYRGYGRIWRLPMTFVIDRAGKLRRDGSVGVPTIDQLTLDSVVTPLLAVTQSSE